MLTAKTDRHWKDPEYDMVELIADILIEQNYATRKMTASYISPAAGGLCEIVSPFYVSDAGGKILTSEDQVDDLLRELTGRKQCDAIENWLHINKPELLRQAKHCSTPVPYDGRQKRIIRMKWCLDILAEGK